MDKAIISVNGMSCQHCVKAVKESLSDLNGVSSVKVDLKEKNVTVDFDSKKITLDRIKDEINEIGYEVVE